MTSVDGFTCAQDCTSKKGHFDRTIMDAHNGPIANNTPHGVLASGTGVIGRILATKGSSIYIIGDMTYDE